MRASSKCLCKFCPTQRVKVCQVWIKLRHAQSNTACLTNHIHRDYSSTNFIESSDCRHFGLLHCHQCRDIDTKKEGLWTRLCGCAKNQKLSPAKFKPSIPQVPQISSERVRSSFVANLRLFDPPSWMLFIGHYWAWGFWHNTIAQQASYIVTWQASYIVTWQSVRSMSIRHFGRDSFCRPLDYCFLCL